MLTSLIKNSSEYLSFASKSLPSPLIKMKINQNIQLLERLWNFQRSKILFVCSYIVQYFFFPNNIIKFYNICSFQTQIRVINYWKIYWINVQFSLIIFSYTLLSMYHRRNEFYFYVHSRKVMNVYSWTKWYLTIIY